MTISLNNFLTKEVEINETNTKESKVEVEVEKQEHKPHRGLHDFGKRINWDKLVDFTFLHYLESNIGRLIVPTESMLKVYFLQFHYGMSASNIEKALNEVDVLRDFALEIDVIPNASSIKAFARLLKENKLSDKIEKAFTIGPRITHVT